MEQGRDGSSALENLQIQVRGGTSTLNKGLQQLHVGIHQRKQDCLKAPCWSRSAIREWLTRRYVWARHLGPPPAEKQSVNGGAQVPTLSHEHLLGPAILFFSSLQLSLLSSPLQGHLHLLCISGPVFLDLAREVFPPALLICCPSDTLATNARMWKRIQESCDCAVELLFSVGGLYQWQEAPVPQLRQGGPLPQARAPVSSLSPAGACLLWGGQAPIAWTCHRSQIALRETLKHTGQSWSGHSWDLH